MCGADAYNPTGNRAQYKYDSRDNLVLIQQSPPYTLTYLTYDNAGRLTNVYNRHGSACGNPCPAATVPADASPIADYAYSRDVDGRITSQTRSGGGLASESIGYGYDALGRLETVTLPNGTVRRFTFDADSNRTSVRETPSGGSEQVVSSYAYDPSTTAGVDELTSVSTGGSTTSYGYTSDGEVSSRGGDALTWDGRGRLSGGTYGGTSVSYAYDALGRLQSRSTSNPSTARRYLYVGSAEEPIAETDATGAIQLFHVEGAAGSYKRYEGPPASGTTATLLFYDGHGNTVATATTTGTRTNAYSYGPFGEPNEALPTNATADRFVGRWHKKLDTQSGLTLMGARPYDASLGRFLAVDPIDGGALNPYDYALQDPLNAYDLDGTDAWARDNRFPLGHHGSAAAQEDDLFFLVLGGAGGAGKWAAAKLWRSLRPSKAARTATGAVDGLEKAGRAMGPAAVGMFADIVQAAGVLRGALVTMGASIRFRVPTLLEVRNWYFRGRRK